MCGRFTLTWPSAPELAKLLGVAPSEAFSLLYRPRWNVAPTDLHWVVRLAPEDENGARREIVGAKWGFAPPPAAGGGRRGPLINARSESVRMPGVREAFGGERPLRGGRCIVPVDGFYEWVGDAKTRRPIWFSAAGGDLLRFAGVWEAAEGDAGARFTIFTTAANDVVAPVHDRMPVILAPGDVDTWLLGDADAARGLLRAAPSGTLAARAVVARANSVKNDDPSCLDAWDPTLEVDLRDARGADAVEAATRENATADLASRRGRRAASKDSTLPLFGETPRAPTRRGKSR